MLDIIGIGDTNIDLIVQVDHIPGHDEKVRGTLLGKFPGGIIGNFCAAAAKFGAKTGVVAKVGKDEFGELCINDFINRGINIDGLVQKKDVDTYFCVVHLDHTGEKALTIVQTSGFLPQKEEINLEYIRSAKYVHMTTLDVDLVDFIFSELVEHDCTLSLDIEATASKVDRKVWNSVLSKLDIAFPNLAGLQHITGHKDPEKAAHYLLAHGVKMVVVTCGSEGVKIFKDNYYYEHLIFPVNVVDTTGAGDCFNGVFISCLARGWTIEKTAKYAAAAAAISIQSIGARKGLPTCEEVEVFLEFHGRYK
jgi:sugar/nucleoside kinase (ribokinase family)